MMNLLLSINCYKPWCVPGG